LRGDLYVIVSSCCGVLHGVAALVVLYCSDLGCQGCGCLNVSAAWCPMQAVTRMWCAACIVQSATQWCSTCCCTTGQQRRLQLHSVMLCRKHMALFEAIVCCHEACTSSAHTCCRSSALASRSIIFMLPGARVGIHCHQRADL
jgi:hypothetical protein